MDPCKTCGVNLQDGPGAGNLGSGISAARW